MRKSSQTASQLSSDSLTEPLPNGPDVIDHAAPPALLRGLSAADALASLKAEGYNELPRAGRRTPLRIIVEVLREPMLAPLVGGGAVYLVLGDLKEAVILLVFARTFLHDADLDQQRQR